MLEVGLQVDEWLQTIPVPQEIVRKHRKRGDYIKLTSLFYVTSPKEKLLTLTQFAYWIFFWDDDIDTGGELCDDIEAALACCASTRACIDACLGPSPSFDPPPSIRSSVTILYSILRDLRAGLGPATREHLRVELCDYVDSVIHQHKARHSEGLLCPWVHLEMRAVDVGVFPFITVNEFGRGFELPPQVRHHEAMKAMIVQSSKLVVLQNEVLSLQKEFKVGQVENMCLMFVSKYNMTVQESVAKVLDLIREHYEDMKAIEARLPWSETDEELNKALHEYVLTARRLMTGTTHWSYVCERYVKFRQMGDDFELVMHLTRG
ncbi:Presilphiperfolan-8-beta-ol synthase [Escovopsis weberi]|uniref:Terpene synthase n=1 Tax=Escovopsis weberi TaxID=150374 RepID=A0A0M8MUV4_ESCWE|nr:Presilphiperfolan-8-beta-ol synthase [Escovopsis weberi]